MSNTTHTADFLEEILYPAFLVRDKKIVAANLSASKQNVALDSDIFDIIDTGAADYAQFTNGRLSVVLKIANIMYYASVLKHEDSDLFIIESDYLTPELCMLEAAARSLREPLANALFDAEALLSNQALEGIPELSSLNRQLHRILKSILNMSDAATYSKQRATKIEYCDIPQKLNSIIKKASQLLKMAQRTLVFRKIKEAYTGYIDEEKLERAVLNMVSAAIQFGDKDSKVKAVFTKERDHFEFSVATGTDANERDAIDKAFFSYEKGADIFEDAENGICNGLILARNAAISHDGTLRFDRPEPDVIRFTISIPIQTKPNTTVHSPVLLPMDYSGGYDHQLITFSDILPDELFK